MTTDIHTLTGAYALDALTYLERAQFIRHTQSCPSCALEAAELRQTAARLADLTSTAPPPGLRVSVLQEIARVRQAPPQRGSASITGRRASPWLNRVAAAAVVVLIAIGAGVAGAAIQEHRHGHPTAHISQTDRILALFAAPDAQVTVRAAAGGGQIVVVLSRARDEGAAILTALPNPGDRAYQLWLIHGDSATSVGLLNTGQTNGSRLFTGIRDAQAFGVSQEPSTGSATPTQPLVANLTLP